ncbi:hypothetical protein BHU72_14320 [Desulfuribacillus stibiiarsenatis]|uniref:ABC transporter permease n=1 Tax=Desulfuribacillus stibiiarsenatis TaxID=1390249 RepID=A0A1E5L7S1_9FIRM|nr:ABC transporter permease [Desulfuribacillus stibiiarsenatis]OEH86098.1 hypothetical protein BHU72_14320 [Desulfuribacillus stibiiarsenatis]
MRLEAIAIKSILRRRQRALFLILILVTAVAIVNTLYQLNRSMSLEIGDTFDKLGPNIIISAASSDHDLSYGGVSLSSKNTEANHLIADDYMKVYQIHDRDSIAVVSPKLVDVGVIDNQQKALLLGIYFQFEEQLKPWWNWQGKLPFKENEVLLGYELAQKLKKTVGGTLILENKEFQITGVLERNGTDEDQILFLPLLTLQDIKNHGERISFIEVAALCSTCPLPEITEQIRHVLPHSNVTGLQESVKMRTDTVERIQEFMVIGTIVIIIISSFVIGMTMMNYVYDRRVEIGILRAVGYRRLYIFEMLLTEALILGTVGGLVGYSLGTFFADFITPYLIHIPLTITYSWTLGLTSVAATVGLTILASLVPIIRATKIDPVEALKI